MAFQSVPFTAEIVIEYTGGGSNMVNVLHAKQPAGYSLTSIQLLASTVDGSIGVDWLPIQTQDVSYFATTVRGLENENDLEATNTANAGPGGDVDVGMPGNVTVAIKKGSGFTGRSARGRIYWIGLPRAALQASKNLLDVPAVDSVELAITTMLTKITNSGWDPVIVSRFTAGAPRVVGITFPWIITAATNLEVDSQRNRLLG